MISAKSLTHVHIANCIGSNLKGDGESQKVEILDAGCGNGELIGFIHRYFREYWPNVIVEIHGFDVSDHGVQRKGFFRNAVETLESIEPNVEWDARLALLTSDQDWPYADKQFDFIVSNQVLEHVLDKKKFFKNVSRCLKTGGYSFHLNPLRHCIQEGHIWIPFSHRIRSFDLLYSYIRSMSRIGVGKYRIARKDPTTSLDEYCRRHADYMLFWTAYSSQSETLSYAIEAGLRSDFGYTKYFYYLKLCQILRMSLPRHYKTNQSALLNFIAIRIFRYVSSVTLSVRKINEY
jgi:SAM-dependent methyltransferase